jgi:hypothetical protein
MTVSEAQALWDKLKHPDIQKGVGLSLHPRISLARYCSMNFIGHIDGTGTSREEIFGLRSRELI